MSSASAAALDAEIVIVGAGMAGLTLALALEQAGLDVILLDAAPPAAALAGDYDGRASAIAFASFRMWRALGVAEELEGGYGRIEEILVTDGRAPDGLRRGGPSSLHLHFDRRELDPAPDGEALGYMIENRVIRAALARTLARRANLTLIAPIAVQDFRVAGNGVEVDLADGRTLRAALLIGADGKRSMVRARAGIGVAGWPYLQTALVCTIAIERPHGGVAHEYFLPSGPFALLPLTGDRFNVVWTERSGPAAALAAMNDRDFHAELLRRVGDVWGAVTLAGPRFSYPLGLQVAERMIAPRVALAGDAAHAIHPIAGQGLNMGLRDVAALAECLSDAARVGLDLGDFTTLQRYQAWRRFDNVSLAAATDGFNRLFSNDWGRLRRLRDLGMAAVGAIGPARRFFMRHAGGSTGSLPKLLRGEPLRA